MTEVTIGMPLYNNAKTLSVALDSLLGQTIQDLRLVLSDDCSQDDTASICDAYARRDPRIVFVRQPVNLGYANFKFVLDRAETPFFMWAAGDDRWAPTFVEENLRALKSDAALVGSVSKVSMETDGKPHHLSGGTYPLRGGVNENIAQFLRDPSDNSRVYSLFRTEILKKSFPARLFYGYDWALSAATLLHGHHNEVSDVLLFRDLTPNERYNAQARKAHSQPILRLFPLLRMTGGLVSEGGIPRTWPIARALLTLNLYTHYVYCETYHPRYFRLISKLWNVWEGYVGWRLRSPRSKL